MKTSSLFPQFEQLKDVEALCVVFFDLVDSSLLKRKLGPVEGVAVAMRHNDLCTQAVEWYGGQVVKYIGDAVMAVFKTPLAGILAALEVKHVIITQGYRFQTKIGVSHGIITPVVTTGADYLGYTVDLGARLVNQAGPNQVVTDEVTFSLLKPVLKSFSQVIFRFIGVQELKGVGKISLIEFTHADLGFAENAPAAKRGFSRNSGAGQELPKLAALYRQEGKATERSFGTLLERITPRDADLEAVSAGFQSVRHVLTEVYDLPVREVVVSGSLARGTMIRPVGDVDLLVLLAETSLEPGKVLQALGRVVTKAG
ncbi:MAG: adenylate/guanylate cyclase domain-containing protein, partial [Heliobacteriaceae bacterium]|nr:adenylate/guanylate cyclase domain-containing protein [Heliobacteriaceae bacterium]